MNSGPDTDAANNDYRRIQNALNAAASGDTIILNGTFDFTQPFAAASWALGNDNTAATGVDYEVLIPAGLNDVTLTANSLGDATIQGPGDLAAINLESFLVFDASLSGASQGWTIFLSSSSSAAAMGWPFDASASTSPAGLTMNVFMS